MGRGVRGDEREGEGLSVGGDQRQVSQVSVEDPFDLALLRSQEEYDIVSLVTEHREQDHASVRALGQRDATVARRTGIDPA